MMKKIYFRKMIRKTEEKREDEQKNSQDINKKIEDENQFKDFIMIFLKKKKKI